MIVETTGGKLSITAQDPGLNSDLFLTADTPDPVASALRLIELVGGAEGEDRAFPPDAIQELSRFGKPVFQATVTRTEVSRWLDAELHNYLDYKSIRLMRAQQGE